MAGDAPPDSRSDWAEVIDATEDMARQLRIRVKQKGIRRVLRNLAYLVVMGELHPDAGEPRG